MIRSGIRHQTHQIICFHKPYKPICSAFYKHLEQINIYINSKKKEDLRESGALGPNAAIVADDGRGREVIAFDFTHEMVIDVGLPRHLVLLVCASEICFRLFVIFFSSYLCCFLGCCLSVISVCFVVC